MRTDLPNIDYLMLISQWSQRRLISLDVIAAILLGVVMTVSSSGSQTVGWVRLLVIVATTAPLAVRRLWPVPVFLVVLIGGITSVSLGIGSGQGLVAAAFALYTVASETPSLRREPTIGLAIAAVGIMLVGVLGGFTAEVGSGLGQVIMGVAAMGVAWTWGRYAQQRQRYEVVSAQQLARASVAEERVRIARELHDIIAHAMSLITVKASVARHVAASRPHETSDALEVIESTSRRAMDEVRTLLAVLQPETNELAPPHRVSDIPQLIEGVRTGDIEVEMRIGDADHLPHGLQTAIYRIVQESLTNVVRHAPGSSSRVVVERSGDDFHVEVTNTPTRFVEGTPRRDEDQWGRGLWGIRERAAMYGGSVDAGDTPDGGFRVRAHFPDPSLES